MVPFYFFAVRQTVPVRVRVVGIRPVAALLGVGQAVVVVIVIVAGIEVECQPDLRGRKTLDWARRPSVHRLVEHVEPRADVQSHPVRCERLKSQPQGNDPGCAPQPVDRIHHRRSCVPRSPVEEHPRADVQIRVKSPLREEIHVQEKGDGNAVDPHVVMQRTGSEILAVERLQHLISAGESDTNVLRESETDNSLTPGAGFQIAVIRHPVVHPTLNPK